MRHCSLHRLIVIGMVFMSMTRDSVIMSEVVSMSLSIGLGMLQC